jgi:hypothetical protein
MKPPIPFSLALLIAARVPAENWPQWRGPNLNGSTPEKEFHCITKAGGHGL